MSTPGAVPPDARPRVLIVDDEPMVLDALRVRLRRSFDVETAASGEEALRVLAREGPFPVVVCDQWMPGMDGVELLTRIRLQSPDTVRVMLSGNADLGSAIAAVNDGHIFRLLTKPSPPGTLEQAIAAGVAQHRLVTAERELLQETLSGSIRVLAEILALAQPSAFCRSMRVRRLVARVSERMGAASWQTEVAAALSHIGCVTLPAGTVQRYSQCAALSPEEEALVARLPAIAETLLANIPRLDEVRRILRETQVPPGAAEARGIDLHPGARILRVALDYESREAAGLAPAAAIAALRQRETWYDPAVLDVVADLVGEAPPPADDLTRLSDLRDGMVLLDDVWNDEGRLLVARGHEVTPALVQHLRSLLPGRGRWEARVRVAAPGGPDPAAPHPARQEPG